MILNALSFLTLSLSVLYGLAVLYFRSGWIRIVPPVPAATAPQTMVSILIAARDEEDKIAATIVDILNQNYPKELFELIVVDDHSSDRTAEIVESYSNHGVKLIKLNEHQPLNSYKKKAIAEAIRLAHGELIVTTDADCRMGPEWLPTIISYYERHGFKLISSPVMFFEEKTLFEQLQTLEFLYLIGLGAATIGNKKPSTCNGANLAYRKDVFEELKGFQGIDELASGDDELFLHKVAARYPDAIGFCKALDAMVYTHAKPTVKEFIRQRKRWASKSTRYKDKKIVVLGVGIWLYNVLLLLCALASCIYPSLWAVCLCALLIKAGTELSFLLPITSFVRRRALLLYLPILSCLHVFYIIYIGVAGNSGKYMWKGRMVK